MVDFLCVIGGLITPTILISGAGNNALNLDESTRQYMISASLIVSCFLDNFLFQGLAVLTDSCLIQVSGIMRFVLLTLVIDGKFLMYVSSFIQIIRFRIPKTRYFIGAG